MLPQIHRLAVAVHHRSDGTLVEEEAEFEMVQGAIPPGMTISLKTR
jgi:hypothetical protein